MPTPPDEKTPASAAGAQKSSGANALTAKTDDAAVAVAAAGTYTVAPGRTVSHGEEHTYGNDGQIKTAGRMRTFKAGDKIELNESEAKRLMALGFILAEDGSVVVRADGPAINVDNGVQVAQERA